MAFNSIVRLPSGILPGQPHDLDVSLDQRRRVDRHFRRSPAARLSAHLFQRAANSEMSMNGITTSMEHEKQMHWEVENGFLRTLGYVYPSHTYQYEVHELVRNFLNTKARATTTTPTFARRTMPSTCPAMFSPCFARSMKNSRNCAPFTRRGGTGARNPDSLGPRQQSRRRRPNASRFGLF
jgi:hypothetical protein